MPLRSVRSSQLTTLSSDQSSHRGNICWEVGALVTLSFQTFDILEGSDKDLVMSEFCISGFACHALTYKPAGLRGSLGIYVPNDSTFITPVC